MKPYYYYVEVSRTDPDNECDIESQGVGASTNLAEVERLANEYIAFWSWAVITKVEPYQDFDDGIYFTNYRTLEIRNYRPEGDVFVLDDVMEMMHLD